MAAKHEKLSKKRAKHPEAADVVDEIMGKSQKNIANTKNPEGLATGEKGTESGKKHTKKTQKHTQSGKHMDSEGDESSA
eukprot:7803824-Alexandrium_andersonii.AAC.1